MNDTTSTKEVLLWEADNVADWLTTIGLEKYVNKFKRYMVTGPVLLQLDDTLLDDFDITSTIDRKTLLESVGHFTGNIEECLTKESSAIFSQGECKATIFPAELPELLPTIGEEEELEVREKNECNEPSIFIPHEDTHKNDRKGQSNENDEEPNMSAKDKKEAHVISPDDMASLQTENLSSSPITKDIEEVASRATQMVQIFSEENMCLRNQLEKYCQELRNLQNVKRELHNSEIMYKDLKGAFINREHKEKAMRMRMEAEITQLQNTNAELTEGLREAQDITSTKAKDELKKSQEEINKRDEVVKQLQKERKNSITSLHNLERMLKQKSSEIINLQRQLEKFCRNEDRSYVETNEIQKEKDIKEDNKKIEQVQSCKSVPRCCCRGTRFSPKSIFPNQKSEFDVPTCVSVLIELLKEKDTEIANMREEIKRMESKLTNGTKENNWLKNSSDEMRMTSNEVTVHNNTETYVQYRNDEQRYCDLETAIKTLHVQLAEKNAAIKILQCKYGENGVDNCQDSSSIISTPFRSPSFTSQGSSTSSYQDSGIVTSYQNIKDFKVDDQRSSTEQEDQAIDHCWFV